MAVHRIERRPYYDSSSYIVPDDLASAISPDHIQQSIAPSVQSPKGIYLFPDTLDAPKKTKTDGEIADLDALAWIVSWFTGTKAPVAKTKSKEKFVPMPLIPAIEAPSPKALLQLTKLTEAARQANRRHESANDEMSDQSTPDNEAQIHKKMIAAFREHIEINEQRLASSIQKSRDDSETIQELNREVRKFKANAADVLSHVAWANRVETGLQVLSLGTVVFVAGGACIATTAGLVPAALPAMMQALGTTAFTMIQTASAGAQAVTGATRTHLESKRDAAEAAALATGNKEEIQLQIKFSHEEWDRIVKEITQFWSLLKQIETKRRDINRFEI